MTQFASTTEIVRVQKYRWTKEEALSSLSAIRKLNKTGQWVDPPTSVMQDFASAHGGPAATFLKSFMEKILDTLVPEDDENVG